MRRFGLFFVAGFCLLWGCFAPPAARALVKVDLLEETSEDDLFLDNLRLQDQFHARVQDSFNDVPRDHWAYSSVERLAGLGLLEGYDGQPVFSGAGPVTRYEMAALVARMVDRYLQLKDKGQLTIGKVPAPPAGRQDPFWRAGMNRKEVGDAGVTLAPLSPSDDAAATPTPQKTEEVVMEQGDVKKLEDLVNGFSGELRDFQTEIKKELMAGKKIDLKNQKDIQSLQEENQRFGWKGRAEVAYLNQGETDNDTTIAWDNKVELDIVSKPTPGEDFTIGATLAAETELGGRKGTEGVFDGSSTALNLSRFSLNYQNPRARTATKKFFFRKVDVGNISVDFSPTTAFGTQWEGAQTQFQMQKWTMNLMAARTQHRRQYRDALGRPFTFIGTDEEGDTAAIQMQGLPYDRYVYGASLQGTFLNNPLSLLRVSQINMFEDEDSVHLCEKINAVTGNCENYLENGEFMFLTEDQVGALANPGYPQDVLPTPGGGANDRVGQLKLPAEKNKVQSVFLRYPISEKNNLFFTGEYARSKYYRPGFKVVKSSQEPPNEDQEPGLATPDTTKFRVVPEQDWEGSAVLALLDWSHGPLKVFPAGYARLSPRFVARYLGLPGIDVSALLNVGGLPLNIQSLEAWLLAPTYSRPQNKYSVGALFAKIQEVEPIYFDPGLITGIPSLGGIAPLTILERLNNRRARLGVGVTQLNGEYYASPRLTLKASYMGAAVNLYDACIDGKAANTAKDLNGNELVSSFGDGIANCTTAASFDPQRPDDTFSPFSLNIRFKTKTLSADWQASKRAKYNLTYSISDLVNNTSSPSELGPNGIIDALFNRRTYTVKQALDYDINNSTTLNLGLERVFDKFPDGSDFPGGSGADPGANGALSSPVDDYYIFTAKVKTEF